MTTTRTEPEAAPASAKASDEKWKTSPGGPLDRRGQTSSGERGQTSSGENERADDDKPVTKRARMDSDGSAKTTEGAIDAAEDAVEATNVDAPSRAARPPSKPAPAAKKEPQIRRVPAERRAPDRDPEGACGAAATTGRTGGARRWPCPGTSTARSTCGGPPAGEKQGAAPPRAAGRETTAVARGGERLGARRAAGFPPHVNGLAGALLLAAPLLNAAASAWTSSGTRSGAARDESGGVGALRAFGGIPGRDCVFGVPRARPSGCDAPADRV